MVFPSFIFRFAFLPTFLALYNTYNYDCSPDAGHEPQPEQVKVTPPNDVAATHVAGQVLYGATNRGPCRGFALGEIPCCAG
ncbi:hypothetical protein LBMAG49_04370 [Planctomycetota bacterium]|nr:hypothetical protein LBMAG49_04370 [Planctomycetota bacterium]